MKLGRTFARRRREPPRRAGVAERAIYVERASSPEQRIAPLREVDGQVPVHVARARAAVAASAARRRRGASRVVGLGPAGPAVADAGGAGRAGRGRRARRLQDLPRPRARRAAGSGATRPTTASRPSAPGTRWSWPPAARASPSSPPATRASSRWPPRCSRRSTGIRADVDVRVVPGLSAMQAAAARVGAPLGHDFAVISLSDNLKPWAVDRAPAGRGRRGRPRARALQPGVAHAARAARAGARRCCAAIARRDTPVVVARAVGSPDESGRRSRRSASVDLGAVDMRTLLIVGSSHDPRARRRRASTRRARYPA